jgi:arginine/ornithine transport system substrate-binding protein
MNKTVGLVLVALLTTAINAGAQDAKKIKIGVEGAYPPFSQIGTDGKLKGFDIDIANALCEQMKAQCTLVQQEFDGLIPSLQAKKIDAVIASMSITDERKKVVEFSEKYYHTPARFVGKKGAALTATVAGMKGKRIGVQRTTTHDRFATDTFKESEIVRYAKQDDVFLDLASGRLDAVMVDQVAASQGFLLQPSSKDFGFFGPVYIEPKYFGAGAGIGLRKNDTALRDEFNAAIKAIRGNGVYKKINDKYFEFDIYGGK